jgi:hypothetical protein
MILLDTNVISELSKERPDAMVTAWFLKQPGDELATTTITFAEVLFGLELLPQGRRRQRLSELTEAIFETALQGRRLTFNDAAAHRYAVLFAGRQKAGVPMPQLDAQIAAIALAAGASLATRNVTDFQGCNLKLIDPWKQ